MEDEDDGDKKKAGSKKVEKSDKMEKGDAVSSTKNRQQNDPHDIFSCIVFLTCTSRLAQFLLQFYLQVFFLFTFSF
jgi:hypothetical protein